VRISAIKLAPSSRQMIYLILVFVSLILLIYSIWQVYPVIVEPKASLGLASCLAPAYWIGLTLATAVSILAFLDREVKKDAIFILILLVLGLFLFGIRAFLYECAQDTDSYYPVSAVYKLLADHHLNTSDSPSLVSYYSWPAIHFMSASLLEITKANLLDIMKYTPVFWILCFVLTTYGIGKVLKLPPDRCFLLSLLALSSFWLSFGGFYYPRLIAMMLFLLLFMLLLKPKRAVPETVAIIAMYVALVMSHGEVAISALLGLILLCIYKRDYRLLALFVVITSAWYTYQVAESLRYGISYLTTFFRDVLTMSQTERYQAPSAATGRLVARYSQLLSLGLFGILMIWSLILLVRHKIVWQHRDHIRTIYAWSLGVASFAVFGMSQSVVRSYIKCTVPAAGIIALSFYSKKLLVPLILIFIPLSLLVNYAALAGFGQATVSELDGSRFLAIDVKPDNYFAMFNAKLAFYYDPRMVTIPAASPQYSGAVSLDTANTSVLDKYHYVVTSQDRSNSLVFAWGEDPYAAWPQTEVGGKADLIYSSGYFEIYRNDLAR
jgi:hypothetical protein